ncbi:MAG: Lrp/AsnC family transcriptional regulator [Gordonia sp. (in: high G+C Gram-positive bacteria)]
MSLDDLDRRIVGALQVDGRASWRRIAEVLDVPFSTVGRRGSALLAAGLITVVAIPAYTHNAIIEVEAAPARLDAVARALAARPDTIFVYALSAPSRIIVEEAQSPEAEDAGGSLARTVLDEIPAIDGVTGVMAAPVLRYYRTLTEWMPGLLTTDEVAALKPRFGRVAAAVPMEPADHDVYAQLVADGRMSVGDIASATAYSEATVRRRLAGMIDTKIRIRTVVAPRHLGLEVSAFLWIRVAPHRIEEVAEQLLSSPYVRYAAMTMGDHQLLVDIAAPSLDDLRRLLTEQPWAVGAESIRTSPVLAVYKTSGIPIADR